jgi:glyoxylase-like metal-dependent hydrolase (beta-lactamase superfamily II)
MLTYPFPPPAPEDPLEVLPGLLWLRLPLPWAINHVNVYALEEPEGWTLIDTGIDSAALRAHWEAIESRFGKVRRVLATHHHPDHMGLAAWFMARGAELLAARTGWLMARMLVLDEEPDLPAARRAFLARGGMVPPEGRPFNACDWMGLLPQGYTRLHAGETLHLGGRDWQIRFGQGHAPDQVTLWSPEAVIMGDHILPGISPNIGVQAAEPGADPLGEFLTSLAEMAPHAGDQLVLPGHQRPFHGLSERIAALEAEHRTALDRLEAHLATPRTAFDCFPALFRRAIGPSEAGLALAETLAHLNRLVAEGRAKAEPGPEAALLWRARQ